jgi:hypothetical protein
MTFLEANFTIFFQEKIILRYKPCPLTSLSGRKSCELFAFPIEKINFFFWLAKIVGRLKKLSHPQGDVRSIRNMLKNVPHS